MFTRLRIRQAFCVMAGAILFTAGGCTKYYEVTDPSTGKVYYTTSLDERSGGAVALRDANTGANVTVQNSEVRQISEEAYRRDRRAAAARAAEPPAETRTAEAAKPAEAALSEEAQPAAAAAAGAGGTAAAAAAAQAQSAEGMRRQLTEAKQQVDRTLTSLSQLADPAQADVAGAYKRYGEQLDALNKQAELAKVEADAMRKARTEYFAKWDAKMAQIQNPTIREGAEARRTRLREGQERIVNSAVQLRDAYQPFMSELQDIRKFVGEGVATDSTAALGPAAKKAQQDGVIVKQKIDALIAELDAVEGRARPSGTPAPGQSAPAGQPAAVSPGSASPAPGVAPAERIGQ